MELEAEVALLRMEISQLKTRRATAPKAKSA
jgi:uncharacterized small protein (DUF1192 family)